MTPKAVLKAGETSIGGNDTSGTHSLQDGDVIGIGTKQTRYRYRFISLDND